MLLKLFLLLGPNPFPDFTITAIPQLYATSHRNCGITCKRFTVFLQTQILQFLHTDQPKDVEVSVSSSDEIREGNPLTLICKSKANPAVTNYSWFKIRDANVSSVGSGSELTIRSASLQDAGLYFCTATNHIGMQKSTVIALNVKGNRDCFIN